MTHRTREREEDRNDTNKIYEIITMEVNKQNIVETKRNCYVDKRKTFFF